MKNVAHGLGQAAAQDACGYGAITLVRIGDEAHVQVECGGKSYTVIKEHLDGNFCHTVEPLGIVDELQRQGAL